jgi:hypothetical protein
MHQAEGELFRDPLVAGARACDLPLTTLPGKSAGAPWGKDQKEAAAAAFVALGDPKEGAAAAFVALGRKRRGAMAQSLGFTTPAARAVGSRPRIDETAFSTGGRS